MNDATLSQIIDKMGDAGLRMSEIEASEGAAGNISVYHTGPIEPGPGFPPRALLPLPVAVPQLVGGWVVVTGSTRRLRDVGRSPETTLCLLHVELDGAHAQLYGAEGIRPTSELNTHLAVHDDHVGRRQLKEHAIVHAQPIHLTYLSHIPSYQETERFNRRLLRWQPETIVEFPEGIGMLPFQIPGSPEQMGVTTEALARYRGVVWARHGIVTRADDVRKASDLVDYAEAAARYEYLNLAAGEPSSGLSDEEMRQICERLRIDQPFY